jgi:hypothetical protein
VFEEESSRGILHILSFCVYLQALPLALFSLRMLFITFLQRSSAKELLKHRFIKNARKTAKLLERIRFVVYSYIKNWLNGSFFLIDSRSISISISFVCLLLALVGRGQNLQ